MTGADSFFSIIKGGSDSVTNPRIPRGFPSKIGVTGPKFGSQTQAKWSHASQILEFDEASSQICGARGVHQGFTGGSLFGHHRRRHGNFTATAKRPHGPSNLYQILVSRQCGDTMATRCDLRDELMQNQIVNMAVRLSCIVTSE